ncbi:hypothetical protein [Microcoleus sp. bin38.metabat.b11b12b14.051]|uniref:hypothetical protein n=1 Tax=Microcoleus sp. bin38.metabat.b11b12b14.051 TaxID=2742709 RepID=UPI0025D01DAD|nr:hypothetical protein [Microcoleus sp. bin38.metabat.b11b12b14.051]
MSKVYRLFSFKFSIAAGGGEGEHWEHPLEFTFFRSASSLRDLGLALWCESRSPASIYQANLQS